MHRLRLRKCHQVGLAFLSPSPPLRLQPEEWGRLGSEESGNVNKPLAACHSHSEGTAAKPAAPKAERRRTETHVPFNANMIESGRPRQSINVADKKRRPERGYK